MANRYVKTGEDRVCPVCGKGYYVQRQRIAQGRGKWCSKRCRALGEKRRPPASTNANREGENNPNFRHGERLGERAGVRRFVSGQAECARCGSSGGARAAHEHHVVYRQHVRRHGGDEWDGRNALRLCFPCHSQHHRKIGVGPIEFRLLRRENIEFAVELLGLAAWDYFQRYYNPTGLPSLDEFAREYGLEWSLEADAVRGYRDDSEAAA